MLDKISAKIANNWIEKKIIDINDKEIYEYGIILTMEYLLSLITTALIAVFTGEAVASVTFYTGFKYLRSYTGGIHAKTFAKCYVSSSLIILISVLFIKYNIISIVVYRMCGLPAIIYLVNITPIDCENKRVSKEEKRRFCVHKNKVVAVICFIIVLAGLCDISIIEKSLEAVVIIVSLCCIFA
ncbi:MAG: accessory gene regulator B family protein [Lachnospiraceae bacterium]|nr:accessory gene regulator B family protein [Lachnospiraceae bacterium]